MHENPFSLLLEGEEDPFLKLLLRFLVRGISERQFRKNNPQGAHLDLHL